MKERTFLSRKGYHRLVEELENLKKRVPELSREIAAARELGDLRENAEYHAAKETLAQIQKRISQITAKLSSAKIIEEQDIPVDRIYIGSTVRLKDLSDGEEYKYTIVDIAEACPQEGKISVNSPMAQGLLGKKVGEIAEINLPSGKITLKVIEIYRES